MVQGQRCAGVLSIHGIRKGNGGWPSLSMMRGTQVHVTTDLWRMMPLGVLPRPGLPTGLDKCQVEELSAILLGRACGVRGTSEGFQGGERC